MQSFFWDFFFAMGLSQSPTLPSVSVSNFYKYLVSYLQENTEVMLGKSLVRWNYDSNGKVKYPGNNLNLQQLKERVGQVHCAVDTVALVFILSFFFYHLDLVLIVFIHVNLCIHSSCFACAHEKVYFSLQIIHARQTNTSETVGKRSHLTAKGTFCMKLAWVFGLYNFEKNTLMNCFIAVFCLKYILSHFSFSFGTSLLLC